MEQFRFGRPSQELIDEVQRLETDINSGYLDEVDEATQKSILLDLAANNFDSLPENIKSLHGVTASDKTNRDIK
jgi:predicted transcriptional regulator